MNATATATPDRTLIIRNLEVAPQQYLPVALPPIPTQEQLIKTASEKVVFTGLTGFTGTAALGTSVLLGSGAVHYGQPLLENFASLNFSDPTTLLTAVGAAAAGAGACYVAYRGVEHLVAGAKTALELGRFALHSEGKTHPQLEHNRAGWRVTLRTFGTQALAALGALGTGVAAAGYFLAQSPSALYAGAAGVAALLASVVVGRGAIQQSVAWAGHTVNAEVQLRIATALEAAQAAGTISAAAIDAPTPDQQPAASA